MSVTIPYPQIIELDDGSTLELTDTTWKSRHLVIETDQTESVIRNVFTKEGFKNESLEFKKPNQIGNGLSKKIKDWQVHVRFIPHGNNIQIDGEVEVSNKYLEHLTHGWISAFKETMNIVLKYFERVWVFHKGVGRYVSRIIKEGTLTLLEPQTKTDWVVLGLTLFAATVAGLAVAKALKS